MLSIKYLSINLYITYVMLYNTFKFMLGTYNNVGISYYIMILMVLINYYCTVKLYYIIVISITF